MKPKKPAYKVTLVFESETAAQNFARRVMSREPPIGTETVYCVSEDYPKFKKAMDDAKKRCHHLYNFGRCRLCNSKEPQATAKQSESRK